MVTLHHCHTDSYLQMANSVLSWGGDSPVTVAWISLVIIPFASTWILQCRPASTTICILQHGPERLKDLSKVSSKWQPGSEVRSTVTKGTKGGRRQALIARFFPAEPEHSLRFLPLQHCRKPLPLDWSWYVSGNRLPPSVGYSLTADTPRAALSHRGCHRSGALTRERRGLPLSHWPWDPNPASAK